MKELIAELESISRNIKLGGGENRIASEHKKGKLTARERIQELIDPGSRFEEIGLWAAFEMYEHAGGCPSAGVITGLGYINGRKCVIVANDATVKAGAWFPMTAKKNLRAQEIATENHLPIIYLVDSAGVYLPMQDEIFPDKEHFGRIFRNNAQMSARGIPQIAAIMGSCVAGGAYLPIMSDEALIVNGTGSVFLAGSYLVKAAIGENVDNETLGGATTHTEISGVTDYMVKDDHECLLKVRELVSHFRNPARFGFPRAEAKEPAVSIEELESFFPDDRNKPYDMMRVIDSIIDTDSFTEYKQGYGQTIITGYARIKGWSVGIVANQRKIVKSKQGEMQIGGVIYSDSADKATRFILNCNQKSIPLLFLQDVTGFMVGKRSEHGGIIKDGAKMVNAVANSVVPKITVIIGNSYGAGNYAMCGKAYDPRFIYAWPTARIAVMGGAQAAKTLLQIEVAALEKKGESISENEKAEYLKEITDRYDHQTDVRYAASRLWVDEIILPADTRDRISEAIESADHQTEQRPFNVGVIQV
jgi:3-methylcrotonyl-CoA carboxylase beta subunit